MGAKGLGIEKCGDKTPEKPKWTVITVQYNDNYVDIALIVKPKHPACL